ncbi:hypothetical protein N9Q04_00560 [Burkholderiales bacterium]|jgi:hypothetical protein|nr:hypothetical protein [Burkholderiales bacterium]MDC1433237.1 hypothetical protein [Burkholderiales bacterium]
MRILLLTIAGILVGWILIQVLKGRKEPLGRTASIGANVVRLISHMIIGGVVLFFVFLAWQELTRH